MATEINNNLYVAAPKALDDRWGIFENNTWRPFASIVEALTKVEEGLRHNTMVLAVTTSGGVVDYWFNGGVLEEHFVRKDYDKIRSQIIVDGVSQGDIVDGTVFPEGTTQEEIIRAMLSKTSNPVLNPPSLSIASSLPYLVKIGQNVTLTLTTILNRGNIYQAWNNTVQNHRSGPATNYAYTGDYALSQSGSNPVISSNIAIVQGVANFNVVANFSQGPQPINSKGVNFSTRLAASSLSVNSSIEGVYPILATVASITTQNELTLYSMITGNNIQVDMFAESGGNKQTFWMPKVWNTARPVTKIEYFNSFGNVFAPENKLSDWATTEQTIGGILYIRYRYSGSDRGQLKIRIIF